ncbi:MAG: acetyl-CoA carboxylase biotin carboxyl carrier protein subunit [Sphingobacteriales bacterium]|nr:acetyl-CoA carboxylase biotin carboxyl carrier protein subunit [Sphingobacteriales bacterium]
MYQVKINQNTELTVNPADLRQWDMQASSDRHYHILLNHRSYNAEIVAINTDSKTVTVRIKGKDYDVEIKDKMDLLLEQLGMGKQRALIINEIKAPMPGLVLAIKVQVGDTIAKGDTVLVLEAMKMENNIKAVGEGIVKSISVQKGAAVEKNQVLIVLE